MHNYSIVLPNTKAATYRLVTLIVAILNCLMFAFILFSDGTERNESMAITGLVINGAGLLFFILVAYFQFNLSFRIEIEMIVTSILWACMGKYLLAVFLLLFAIIGFYANKKWVIHFNKEGIRYPSFPPKQFSWAEVEQVILKDDILTIDLRNNKLFQFTIDRNVNASIHENAFNEFCAAFKA
jgi:hypothetical protein